MLYNHNLRICEMYTCIKRSKCSWNVHTRRNPKNTKQWRLSWFRYETFITFFKFRFFDTRRERQIFSMLTVRPSSALTSLTQPTRARTPQSTLHWPRPGPKNQLVSSNSKSQLTLFIQNLEESQPIASGHDLIYIPNPIFYLGFLLWDLWLSLPPRTRVNTCTQCVHLTNPCTKSKGPKPN